MKDFVRLFEMGCDPKGIKPAETAFVIEVKYDRMRLTHTSGRNPYTSELNAATDRFLKEYETEFGKKIAVYKRHNRYRFYQKVNKPGYSYSGKDYYIEIDTGNGFPTNSFLFHKSYFGECSDFECFVYDFLDFYVVSDFLAIKDDSYVCTEKSEVDYKMQVFKPRLSEYEDGWTAPEERPERIVLFNACYDKPAPLQKDEEISSPKELTLY